MYNLDMERRPIFYILTFFILLFAYSKWGPSLPISVVSQERGQPLIVEGVGSVVATPDSAKVSFGIEESGLTLTEVQSRASAKSKTLVDAIKSEGVEEENIKTTAYNIYPDYDYSEGRIPRILGYRVSISYEITIKDVEKVNNILVLATENGANVVGGITFEVSDDERAKLLTEARSKAADEAKQKAESLAKAAGVSLGKVLSVSEYAGGGYPIPLLEKAGIGGDVQVPQPEITPGQTEISITVSISYEIR